MKNLAELDNKEIAVISGGKTWKSVIIESAFKGVGFGLAIAATPFAFSVAASVAAATTTAVAIGGLYIAGNTICIAKHEDGFIAGVKECPTKINNAILGNTANTP